MGQAVSLKALQRRPLAGSRNVTFVLPRSVLERKVIAGITGWCTD